MTNIHQLAKLICETTKFDKFYASFHSENGKRPFVRIFNATNFREISCSRFIRIIDRKEPLFGNEYFEFVPTAVMIGPIATE